MLRIGLTGGIGAGKSAVASALAAHGGVVIDSDRLAREVVEPGTPGLAAVVEEFGTDVLGPDGALDRPRLGAVVFTDPDALRRLNAIVHPLVGAASAARLAATPADAVLIHDVPLLVENGMAAAYHLVVVVAAPREVRLERLVSIRGMDRADAEARMSRQSDDAQRAAVADVLVDNGGDRAALEAAADALWADRLSPYAVGLRDGMPAPARPGTGLPDREARYDRAAARLAMALGERVTGIRPAPADPARPEPGRLTIEATIDTDADSSVLADLVGTLAEWGWFPVGPGSAGPAGTVFGSADPGEPALLTLRNP